MEDHGRSRIHLMESSHSVQTARKIIGEKVKESDIRDVTFGLTAGRRRRRRSRRRKIRERRSSREECRHRARSLPKIGRRQICGGRRTVK